MKNNLLRKMMSVGRLTSRGKLVEATLAIQRALAAAPLPKAPLRAAARAPAAARATAARPIDAEVDIKMADVVDTDVDRQPGTVADLDEAGTGERRDAARFSASSFTGASGTRVFKLFEPAGSGNRGLPLVVMLHGCTQNPDDFAVGTRMNELAAKHGCYVLYPEQAARSNAHRCWNWFVPGDQKRGGGEPALLAGMTRHVVQTHDIDPARVYVAGLSAGGAMAAILAREYPELYAAAGIHSGLPAGAAHDVASAFGAMKSGARAGAAKPGATPLPPLIVFHGSADATVAPVNGDAVIAAAITGRADARATATRGTAGAGRGWRRTVWRSGELAIAEQWLVEGAPHAWSGGAAAGSYTDPGGPDASAEMLRFFLEHRQPRPL